MANIMMGTMMGTRMLERTRRALARISWLGSCGNMWGLQCSCGVLAVPPDLSQVPRQAHLESSLEGGNGEQGQILLLLCVAHQVDIYQLLHLRGEGGGATSEPPKTLLQGRCQTLGTPMDATRATQDLPHLDVLASDVLHHGWEEVGGVFTPGDHLRGKGAA